jgi:cephalosporin-C deacetylase-like acetyl esterase
VQAQPAKIRKLMKISRIVVLFLGVLILNSYGENIVVQQSNESGIYKKGEQIKVTAFMNNVETNKLSVKIRKNYSKNFDISEIDCFGTNVIFSGSFDKPTSLIFEVSNGDLVSKLGLVVEPEGFVPNSVRPKDFDEYWANEKKMLKNLPMEVKSVEVPDVSQGYYCADVEINCLGLKPARGYFAKPGSAEPKSLPIVLFVHAAGVKGFWCLAESKTAVRYAKMGKGALSFDLNAHGMLNGQPQEYYNNLEKNELKGYAYQGIDKCNDFYFRSMYLRLIRTLNFLTSQPEWDGQRILVIGESQGGGQALAAAGLDHRVSAVVATVPAMCDWGATIVGQKGGWPNPFHGRLDNISEILEVLPYFDVAHILKDSKATLIAEIGFIDMTCPAPTIYAALNQASGQKIIFGVPYREHGLSQKQYKKTWKKTVDKPKRDFVSEYLK